MSDLDLVIRRSKRLERALRDDAGAKGRGLHQLLSSVERDLPRPLVRQVRFIATVRNKLVHEPGHDRLDDKAGFVRACDEAETALVELRRRQARSFLLDTTFWISAGGVALAMVVGSGILVYLLYIAPG